MADLIRVDSHVHLYRDSVEGRAEKDGYQVWEYGAHEGVHASECSGTVDELAVQMQATGISRAIIVNLFSANVSRDAAIADLSPDLRGEARERKLADIDAWVIDQMLAFNRWNCDLAKTHSGLVPFIAADVVAMPGEQSARHVRDMVESHGAAGVKLHGAFQGFSMADERLWPTYAACQELGIAIIGHSGPDRGGLGYAEPRAFGRVLAAFPELRVVLAHLGGGAWKQALEVAESHANAYFDCCEIMEWTDSPNGPSERELGQLIKNIGPHRVMMGSDFPWYDLDHSIDRVMSLPVLSIEEKEGIVGANAVRILDL